MTWAHLPNECATEKEKHVTIQILAFGFFFLMPFLSRYAFAILIKEDSWRFLKPNAAFSYSGY